MAVKALVALLLLIAIGIGVLLPVPHGDNSAKASSTIPALDMSRG